MNARRLGEILARARRRKAAVVGDLILDSYVRGAVTRISPEAPVPILRARHVSRALGGAANVMRNFTSLGVPVAAYGAIGDDPAGRALSEAMAAAGIAEGCVPVLPGRPTIEKQRLVAGHQQMLRVDYEDDSPLPAAAREAMEAALTRAIEAGEFAAVVIEDYGKGVLDDRMTGAVVSSAARAGVFTALDPNPRRLPGTSGFGLMTPNHSEAYALVGREAPDDPPPVERDAGLADVAREIMARYRPAILLVTLGPRGMALFQEGAPMAHIPTRAREVYDVTGAGDTVVAVFTAAIMGGASPLEAAELSNHAAGIVVGRLGTAAVSPEELEACLAPPAAG